MLELQSISKRYANLNLSDISLAIGEGEYWIVLGPSGVGKTVLLEIIAGLIAPDAGRVCWDGQDITARPPEERYFAMVYQDYALFPHMTVAKNIGYGLRTRGLSRRENAEKVDQLAQLLHVAHLRTRCPETLSGGEQQRVAIARALAAEPRVLLLDEPLSAVDIRMRHTLQAELKRINREFHIPIVHVTHDTEEALRLADRICIILENRMYLIESPEDLFRRPSHYAIAHFLGLENIYQSAAVQEAFPAMASQAHSGCSHIWIRPEEIRLLPEFRHTGECHTCPARVNNWEYRDHFVAVQIAAGDLSLTALLPYAVFQAFHPRVGDSVYATFSEGAVHLLT